MDFQNETQRAMSTATMLRAAILVAKAESDKDPNNKPLKDVVQSLIQVYNSSRAHFMVTFSLLIELQKMDERMKQLEELACGNASRQISHAELQNKISKVLMQQVTIPEPAAMPNF